MHVGRRIGTQWEHFVVTSFKSTGEARTVKCRFCPYTASANATRCRQHYLDRHSLQDVQCSPDSSQSAASGTKCFCNMRMHPFLSSTGSQSQRQASIVHWGDKAFPRSMQDQAEEQLVLMLCKFGMSYSSLESKEMSDFCQTLRSDFHLPSRRTLQRRLGDVYINLRVSVEKYLSDCKIVTLAIDGWSDHQHQETLAVVAKPLLCDSKPVLVKVGHLLLLLRAAPRPGFTLNIVDAPRFLYRIGARYDDGSHRRPKECQQAIA